jgi:hypothetical protein
VRSLTELGVLLAVVGLDGQASACPPAVRLAGDRALIARVTPILTERGIATSADECPAISVRLERRETMMAVSTMDMRDQPTRLLVTDVRTAATIIEGWARTDVEAPLLAPRPRQDAESPGDAPAIVSSTSASASRDVHVFTIMERSLGSDGTGWLGIKAGACVMLGPLCASVQARASLVADGPDGWSPRLERHGVELLLGAELPLRFGRATLSPGVAFGVGWTHTEIEGMTAVGETGGLRAESQLALSYLVTRHVAAELALSFEVAQATHVETSSVEPLPGDARFFSRLGAGVRFEGL